MKLKTIFIYVVEIIIAAILLWFDQRIFFLYFFFCVMLMVDQKIKYLKKIIRIFWLQSNIRQQAIIKHLNIPDEELYRILNEESKRFADVEMESIYKDYDDITK